jgi:CRP-like cAMP-binding protein
VIEILSLYNTISNSDKKLFESKVTSQQYKKGDFLLLDGDIQNKLCLVRSGLLMMYFDNADKRKVMSFAYRNRFAVDINSFSNQTPSLYCIECMEDSKVECISYEDLMDLFNASNDIERAYRILTERILSSVLKRHLDLSCLSIEERFHEIVSKRPELFSLVQHKYIASYLNIDPTNFSKLYNSFTKNHIRFY